MNIFLIFGIILFIAYLCKCLYRCLQIGKAEQLGNTALRESSQEKKELLLDKQLSRRSGKSEVGADRRNFQIQYQEIQLQTFTEGCQTIVSQKSEALEPKEKINMPTILEQRSQPRLSEVQDDEQIYSPRQSLVLVCQICQTKINQQELRLGCQDAFHFKCLHDFCEKEIKIKKAVQTRCLCGQKFEANLVLDDPFLSLLLFRNQLEALKEQINKNKKQKVKQCTKNACVFFHIARQDEDEAVIGEEPYCPICCN